MQPYVHHGDIENITRKTKPLITQMAQIRKVLGSEGTGLNHRCMEELFTIG
jgi:hypothetical protein